MADERTDELTARLVQWQWPDGGWNCDKNPGARHSSFIESLIPLRGLMLQDLSLKIAASDVTVFLPGGDYDSDIEIELNDYGLQTHRIDGD